MPNYANGKIYSIRSHQTNDVYIGSTTVGLSMRMARHRSRFKSGKLTCTSKEIVKYNDAYIELIENYPCEDKEQLHRREGQVIRATENCVNRCVAGRTKQEYRDDKKNDIKQYHKQYREDHKIERNRQASEYYHANKIELNRKRNEKIVCACGRMVSRKHIPRHKRTAIHLKNI